jgi:CRISPR/Cas system-associated exonuclease Cas4 (RecB family)
MTAEDVSDENSSRKEMSEVATYSSRSSGNTPDELIESISEDRFLAWYQERQFRQNIENGQPYFNGPSSVPDRERHNPSNLLQCHRKIFYQQYNAPAEEPEPHGIYWFGTRFEEEIIFPFLKRSVTGPETYVCNSIWVDFTADTQGPEIQIKGETDPVIVDTEGIPVLPTEIKSKSSIDRLSSPSKRHRAQLHAYMVGLSEQYNIEIKDAVLIYGSRNSFRIKPFHISFDEAFWDDVVLQWAADHTEYRLDNELPPPEPTASWECEYCNYRERCGRGKTGFQDLGPTELLPQFTEYPKDKIVEHLDAHPDVCLPPTLAHEYPALAASYDVYQWECPQCSTRFDWYQINQEPGYNVEWFCPNCLENDSLVELHVPVLSECLADSPLDKKNIEKGDDG